jgi:CBS domain containing-hemolysin-like protein
VEKKALENEEDRKQKKTEKTPSHARWVIRVFLIAVALSAAMSLCSGALLEDAGYVVATLILLLFIALGILFDIIGVAVTAANPKPFNSMAAHRVKGAKEALYLIRNAEKVASFCNDVVGDICGIVSGTTTAVIVVRLQTAFALPESVLLSVAVTALVSGLTIGGKALGKTVALNKSTSVVYWVGRFLHLFHR